MGHSNGHITAPVNTDDVSATINVNSHDYDTLCNSSKINKWSEFKPTDDGTALTDTPASLAEADFPEANYGLEVPALVGSPVISADPKWAYIPRRWARIDDFVGYYHYASAPYSSPGDITVYADDEEVTISATAGKPVASSSIRPTKMKALRDMYICLAVVAKGGAVFIQTSGQKIGEGAGASVTLKRSSLPDLVVNDSTTTEYTYHLCASQNAMPVFTQLSGVQRFRALPADTGNISGKLIASNKYGSDFMANIFGVASSIVTGNSGPSPRLTDVRDFIPKPPSTPGGAVTYGSIMTDDNGNIALGIEITATGKYEVVIDKTHLRATVANSLSQSTYDEVATKLAPYKLYTATFGDSIVNPSGTKYSGYSYSNVSEVTEVRIAPGQTKSIIAFFSRLLYLNDAGQTPIPATGIEKTVSVYLYYLLNGKYSNVKGSVNIRVKK